MNAEEIYHKMRAIAEPHHAYYDQMVAIAHWIEAEFEYRPDRVVGNLNPRVATRADIAESTKRSANACDINAYRDELLTKMDSMKESASHLFTASGAKTANAVLDNVKVHISEICKKYCVQEDNTPEDVNQTESIICMDSKAKERCEHYKDGFCKYPFECNAKL